MSAISEWVASLSCAKREGAISELRSARTRLVDVGWIRGQLELGDDNGKLLGYCVVGAVAPCRESVSNDQVLALRALNQVAFQGDAANQLTTSGLVEWNDAEGRTKEQVVELIDKTIARLMETTDA